MRWPKFMRSNWWPIAAYLVMLLWLVVVNHRHIGLDFGLTKEHYAALAQLDSVAHFTAALSLATTFTMVYGPKWTLPKLLVTILAWEIFEALALTFMAPNLFAQPGRPCLVDLVYLCDTLDDIALGVAAAFLGCHFTEPLNSTSRLEKVHERA